MRSFSSFSSLSVVRKCCITTIVPLNPEQHWARGLLRVSISLSSSNFTRRRPGLTGGNAGFHQAFRTSPKPWDCHIQHEPAFQGTLIDTAPAPARATTTAAESVADVPPASHHARSCSTAAVVSPKEFAMTTIRPAVSTAGATAEPPANVVVASSSPAAESERTATAPAPLGPPYDQHITSDFLGSGSTPGGRKVYLIVLNYFLPAGLLHVWPLASFRICADGGCNRLYDELPSMMQQPPAEVAAVAGQTAGAPDGARSHESTTGRDATAADGAGGHAQEAGSTGGSACVAPVSNGNGCSTFHASNGDPHRASVNGSDLNGLCSGVHVHSQQPCMGTDVGPASDWATTLRLAYLPDVVLGDLDSLRSDVQQYYVQHGVPFMDMSHDQDTNDLAKAITLIEERCIRPDPDFSPDRHQILVLGALGGRLDHTLANLNALHMFPHLNVTLWGDGNLVRLVRPGKALITPDERFEGPTCGLIPIAGPVTATSTGLRWNVSSTTLRVGGLVSSSNLLTGTPVEVSCDGPLLWSTEVRAEPQPDVRALWARATSAAAAARKREAQRAADTGDEGLPTAVPDLPAASLGGAVDV